MKTFIFKGKSIGLESYSIEHSLDAEMNLEPYPLYLPNIQESHFQKYIQL